MAVLTWPAAVNDSTRLVQPEGVEIAVVDVPAMAVTRATSKLPLVAFWPVPYAPVTEPAVACTTVAGVPTAATVIPYPYCLVKRDSPKSVSVPGNTKGSVVRGVSSATEIERTNDSLRSKRVVVDKTPGNSGRNRGRSNRHVRSI